MIEEAGDDLVLILGLIAWKPKCRFLLMTGRNKIFVVVVPKTPDILVK